MCDQLVIEVNTSHRLVEIGSNVRGAAKSIRVWHFFTVFLILFSLFSATTCAKAERFESTLPTFEPSQYCETERDMYASIASTTAKLVSRSVKSVRSTIKSSRWGGHIMVTSPDYSEIDPFIFLVHHVHSFKPGAVEGFSAHPHRGFETVTYCIEGGLDHADSRGNKGRYGNGDIQWMSAGSGVLHSEMFVTSKKKPTTFDGFQLWLNLPAKLKMTDPKYKMLWKNDIPVVKVPGGDGGDVTVTVIAGAVDNGKTITRADVETTVPLSYLHIKLPPQTSFAYPTPQEHNSFVYLKIGSALVGRDKQRVPEHHYAVMSKDGAQFEVFNDAAIGGQEAELLFFEGQPHDEPFAHQGPFVMNTQEQLMQAITDFRAGKFGLMAQDAWISPVDDE